MTHVITEPVHGIGYRMSERDEGFDILKEARFVSCTHSTAAVLQIGRSLVRSQMVSVDFFIEIKSFRSHYGPGVDSASNRNEYQEYFLGVKAAGT